MAVLAKIAGIAGQCDRLPRIALKVVATMTKEGPTWPVSLAMVAYHIGCVYSATGVLAVIAAL